MPRARCKDVQFDDIRQRTDVKALANAAEAAFRDFDDPRIADRCLYPAWTIILVLIMPTIAKGETVGDMALWSQPHEKWLREISPEK